MRSVLVVLLGCVVLAALVAACGGQPEALPAPGSPEAVSGSAEGLGAADAEMTTTGAQVADATGADAAGEAHAVGFAADVVPLLTSRCVDCHGREKTAAGLSVASYADLMAGSEGGPVVVPGDAGASLLVEVVVSQEMPKGGAPLSAEEVRLLSDWVDQGALDD